MFERIKRTVKNWMLRAGADLGISKEFKDIFELDGVPAFRQFYDVGIFVWKMLYKGYYEIWHLVPAPTVSDETAKRRLFFLNLFKAAAAEIAGMVWTDQTSISISTNGFEPSEANPDDPLDAFAKKILRQNNFTVKMQEAVEKTAALGGTAMKVWRETRHDREGKEVPNSARIKIGWCAADQFVPTAWDNAEVTEAAFISRQAKGGYYYTRVEWHRWDGLTYFVTNELFRAEIKKNQEPQDILGVRVPLAEIFPLLDDETPIEGLEASLFSYFRTPTANNIDDNSPLGVSMFANAMDTLRALDICFDSFVREFRLGKKRIIVPARMIRTVVDPQSGEQRRYFDATDETYEALSTDDPDSLKIQDNSVELRVEEHIEAINAFLNIFCLQIGLSAGTFSFDAKNNGIKTATEVVSENSKTYKTVKTFQNMIRPAVIRLVENIIAVAALYGMETEDGQKISALQEAGYSVNVGMDDGITQDRQTNINEGISLVGAGLMSKKKFLTDPKYGQALTPEDAEKELRRIAEEQRMSAGMVDRIDLETAE